MTCIVIGSYYACLRGVGYGIVWYCTLRLLLESLGGRGFMEGMDEEEEERKKEEEERKMLV